MKLLILLFFSPLVFAQTDIDLPFYSNDINIIEGTRGLSVYDDYQDRSCTQFFLDDGVCPDYLQGGCAQIGECKLIIERREKERMRRRE